MRGAVRVDGVEGMSFVVRMELFARTELVVRVELVFKLEMVIFMMINVLVLLAELFTIYLIIVILFYVPQITSLVSSFYYLMFSFVSLVLHFDTCSCG